jgi:predicted acylesterase/phospholipase RssA
MDTQSNVSASQDIKLGLALSGGGFRASFFHIGVLAKLAMLGLLRHIQVISTVSGGSIIGALYYLHVKKLLEAKADDAITDQDYKARVEAIERDFFKAVSSNFRLRTFVDLGKNLKTRQPNYSHTDRIGELFDEDLYRPVLEASSPVLMRALKIQPHSASPDFDPGPDNAGRKAKVPILVMNATTLNTGRNWQFTAATMGEPPHEDPLSLDIDKKPTRLRRPYAYTHLPPLQQDFRLGHAVAASACVPGIFHPLAISDTYPEIRVQLVDGGVHDNQAIQGLLDEGCTHFILSDASKLLGEDADPDTDTAAVLNRADDIFQGRLRDEQVFRVFDIKSAARVAFMHLRKGLPTTAVSWLNQSGQPAKPAEKTTPEFPTDEFHVHEDVQDLLSKVRTDLDSFTQVEAASLMLDAYRMTEAVIPRAEEIKAFISSPLPEEPWGFHAIAPWLREPNELYRQQLEASSELFLKVFRLVRPKWLGEALRIAVSLVPVALVVYLAFLLRDCTLSLGTLVSIAVIGAALYFLRTLADRFYWLRPLRTFHQALARLVGRTLFSIALSPLLRFHLRFINPLFLKLGAIDNLGVHDKN